MTNSFKVTIPAVEGKINAEADRIKMYTAEVPANVVANFYVEAAINTSGGFQRLLDPNRAAKIGRLEGGDKARKIDPVANVHGGLLAYADKNEVTFKDGQLTINKPLRLIDGQHRAGGAEWAVKNGITSDYTETVRVVVGATRPELAMWYLRCNLEARKVAPANIIQNVAMMNGIVLRRKSWIARIVIALSTADPFLLNEARLVSFTNRDGGRISAQTLYRAVDIIVPDELDQEGSEVEEQAAKHAWTALDLYSRITPEWGSRDEGGKFTDNPAYGFTTLVAFARLYNAVWSEDEDEDEIEKKLSKAYEEANITNTDNFGSGEKAAFALASYVAAKADISMEKLSKAA